MTGKTHQIIGLTAGLAYFLSVTNPEYSPATLAAVLVGSHLSALIPDADTSAGLIWKKLPFGKIFGRLTSTILEHRNLSHSLLGTAIFGYLAYNLFKAFPSYWGVDTSVATVACIIAYISHLIADMLTVEGIPILFPIQNMMGFPPRPFEGIRIVTGKWFENLVIFPIINLIFIILIIGNWEIIKRVMLK